MTGAPLREVADTEMIRGLEASAVTGSWWQQCRHLVVALTRWRLELWRGPQRLGVPSTHVRLRRAS